MTTACMGGFCPIRERCRHYVVEGVARYHRQPVERLCEPKSHEAFLPTYPVIQLVPEAQPA